MKLSITQQHEHERIEALYRYEILDSPKDGAFDKMTTLAAKIFNVPIAIISLVDTERIWFKSHFGLEINQIEKSPGLCASAILSDDIYLVEDARNDPRSLANPLVAGDFGLQFYAAAPLSTKDGHNLGTFCIIDKRQRYINSEQQDLLRMMSSMVMDEIELRLSARKAVKASTLRIIELQKEIETLKT